MSSEAEKARRMDSWARINVVVKTRLRMMGSCSRWFWLAMIMRGRSQHERTNRGEEIWSIDVQGVKPLFG